MGKIIVKNIKGMGWKAKIGLIAMLTMGLSLLLYQGWRQSQDAYAAITQTGAWTKIYDGTATTMTGGNYAVPVGQSRILVVGIAQSATASGTVTAPTTITYGGVTLTSATTNGATSGRAHTWLYYLKDNAVMNGSAQPLNVTFGTIASLANISVWASSFSGVDQAAAITVGNNLINTAGSGPAQLSAAMAVNANQQAVYISNIVNTVNTTIPGYTINANWTGATANTGISGTTLAWSVQPAKRAIPATNTTDAAATSAITPASSIRYAMSAMSLTAATTTLGNGVAGTTGNVAPGASAQKLDGFSFVTSSAGTTDSVTGLTVTTTNQAAIASMQIWNDAGMTQYFATVNNPGSNTWSFSGGTPIPVTNTAANYKILVTYKTRAGGAPAGNTATTANVTAYTSSNIQAAGTDTADTTLTLNNTHAASTWGTNTPGNAQVTLNWTYGTAGQSVVIIRYTANTDSTKPADGTTYGVGSAFGTGGTVRYVGTAATFTDSVGLVNGTTYYYKIFEYDSYTNYYNATDVWTAGLTPISPDAVPPTVDAGFAATTPVNALNVPITSFGATDNVGGSGVAAYLITTTSAQPSPGAAGWTTTPPATFTAAGEGTYTLYPWAKDAGNNVSPLYGAPVTVVVDTTPPAVSAFTVNTPASSLAIPIASFTATDGGSGIGGYMITTTSTAPLAGAAGWTGTVPGTFTVAGDGTYTLYPWAKDAAGNVSAIFGTPRTVLVDTAPPTGLAATSPADTSTGQPLNVALQSTTATDSGSGGVTYWFEISDGAAYSVNSGWIAGTSFAPAGLAYGTTYTWRVKAKDALGNQTALSVPRTFTTGAACVRNDPTLTLLTPTGGIASTITADGGTSVYNLKIINNDYGGCGSTQFNLSVSDTDLLSVFDPPAVGVPSVTLAPGAQTTTTVTVKATAGDVSGVSKTRATSAADAYHASMTTGDVQTTLNVIGCTAHTPLLIVGPDSGYLNRGGSFTYTVTVKNTDTGTGCSPVTYNLSIPAESNTTDFNGSSFNTGSLVVNAGELASAALTVSAKPSAVKNAVNLTTIGVAATAHATPANKTVTTTVNNPMLHNSDNTGSTKWSGNGGWGIPGARYGEFTCNTCHIAGGADTGNIKRIRPSIFTPYTSGGAAKLPGNGQPVGFTRMVGTSPTQNVLGWDSGATPRANSSKICEVCHTYDAARINGVMAHPNSTAAALGNHFNTDGTDCIRCHKHQKGFGVAGMTCTGCHGDSTVANPTAANRYAIAPPANASGLTGALTGIGQVSNNPKVGAHQTHLRLLNGFTNYSTVDYRCQNCHGPLPADFAHGSVSGSATPAFQGLAIKGGMSPVFNSTNRTCSNTYCHNPAGSGILLAANAGSNVFPSWTSAGYVSSGTKSVANCSVCHKVPGVPGFEPAGTHSGMNTDTQDCAVCHGHNGDASGTIPGRRHMDGIKYGAGDCNTCHDYDTVGASYSGGVWTGGTWGKLPYRDGLNPGEGWGAHVKHINYIKTRLGKATLLDPTNQTFGAGDPGSICGTCHTNLAANHTTGGSTVRSINFGDGLFKIGGAGGTSIVFGSANPVYNGTSGVSSASTPKTCSNISCHYFTTPVWSTY